MKTVKDNIAEMAESLQQSLMKFLTEYSSIHLWNIPSPHVVVISTTGDYDWNKLSEGGRKLQSKLLDDYRTLHAIVSALLSNQAKDTQKSFESFNQTISKLLHQNEHTRHENTADALAAGIDALKGILELINRSYSQSSEALFVPDSNALISNPALEKWKFQDFEKFTIILVAPVLGELDSLKMNHRNEDVRNKAEQVIRQIKEYRRRGQLQSGVPILSNRITLRSIATEPKLSESLPWLDPQNPDDRIIAATIEIMRMNPDAQVTIISGDINVQNKAELARIPYCEPP